MEPAEQSRTLKLVISQPLERLIAECAVHCVVECCELDAFDVNAFTFFGWIQSAGVEAALLSKSQLDSLVDSVAAHNGPVVSDFNFCHTWDLGQNCADYLAIWQKELARALVFHAEGKPSAIERLSKAQELGKSEYCGEVRRITGEAVGLLNSGSKRDAMNALTLIASLDSYYESISNEVKYARRIIEEQTDQATEFGRCEEET